MGADGGQQQVPGRWLHDGAAGGHGVAGGSGGCAGDNAVAAHLGELALLCKDIQPYNPCNGALGDDGVVESDVVIHGLSAPEDGHVQHHPGLHVEAPVRQIPQAVQLVHLQLRHESEASQIHSQHRDAVQRHRPGQMQNGAVAAEGDDHVRAAQLLLERTDIEAVALGLLLVAERHAHDVRTVNAVEDALGLLGDGQLMVAVGVWTKYYLFKHRFRLSFPPAPRGTPRPEPSGHGPAAPPPHGRDSRDIQCSPRGRE